MISLILGLVLILGSIFYPNNRLMTGSDISFLCGILMIIFAINDYKLHKLEKKIDAYKSTKM
jgi:uncharacterized membrane protein